MDPASAHCYRYLPNASAWEDAQAECAESGGHLATFASEAELGLVEELLVEAFGGNFEGAWIGLQRDTEGGSFAWVSGEAFVFANWNSTEPNDMGGDICAYSRAVEDWFWHDTGCATAFPFVCEWAP